MSLKFIERIRQPFAVFDRLLYVIGDDFPDVRIEEDPENIPRGSAEFTTQILNMFSFTVCNVEWSSRIE